MAKKPAESPAASLSHTIVEPDQLSSVLDALGMLRPRHQVRVYRINEQGQAEAVRNGRFTADKCDEYVIAERYGGGEYRADVVDPQGMIRRQVRVYVPANVEPSYVEPAAEISRPETLGEFKASILAEVRDALRAIAPAPAPAANGLDLNGVASLITALRMGQDGLKPSDLVTLLAQQQRAPMSELIAGLRELQGLAGGNDDPPGEDPPEVPATIEETFMRELVSLGKEFVALQRDKRRGDKPAPAKRVENEAPRASQTTEPAKRSAIDRLALLIGTNAAAEIEPDLCAEAVVQFVSRNVAELQTAFDFQRPMAEQLIARAPGLAQHAQYVAAVETAVKRMSDDNDDQDDKDTTGADAGATQGDQQ